MLECLTDMKQKHEDSILQELLNNSLNILWQLPEFADGSKRGSNARGLRQNKIKRDGFDITSCDGLDVRNVGANRYIMSEDEEWITYPDKSKNLDPRNTSIS